MSIHKKTKISKWIDETNDISNKIGDPNEFDALVSSTDVISAINECNSDLGDISTVNNNIDGNNITENINSLEKHNKDFKNKFVSLSLFLDTHDFDNGLTYYS